jgi:hypothetical protein
MVSAASSKQAVAGKQAATRIRGLREGPRGSVINFDDREPGNLRRVAVKCGGPCGRWFRWRKYTEWPGRCPDCSLGERRERWQARREQRAAERAANPPQRRQLEPVVRLPEFDNTIERDPDRPTYGWVRCPVCQDRRYVHIPTGKKRQSFTGRCRRHQPARGQRRGVLLHPTGTEIFFDEREPGNYQKVAAKCHGCGGKKFVWVHELRREAWSGLCHDCIKQRRPYNRRAEDLLLPSGSIVHFSESVTEKYEKVPITCGLCGERWYPRRWHALKSVRDPDWSGYCPECRHRPARGFARLMKRAQQDNPEQRAVRAVEAVWGNVRALSLPFEKRLRLVTGIEIAKALALGAPDTDASFDQLRKQLERAGVKDRFSNVKQWFPAWVKSVVVRLEANWTTPSS